MARVVDGRFELVERLGGGGMGTVWRARDQVLHREVAIKEVRPPDPAYADLDPDGARMLRARVLREARALARIDHPHVVTVHHIVDSPGEPYPWIVMELVTGGSLADRLAQGPMEPAVAARLGVAVLSALRAAHAAGVEHRDVKPANVLLRPDGSPVLTDFGIAAVRESTNLTATGSVIGTPDYMAPERVGGGAGGPAADLWSLGLLLYVAVEGHHPLRRANTLATLAAVLSEDVPPPVRAGTLTGVLTAVLVRDPAARPDAATLDGMLTAAAQGRPVPGPAPAPAAAPTPAAPAGVFGVPPGAPGPGGAPPASAARPGEPRDGVPRGNSPAGPGSWGTAHLGHPGQQSLPPAPVVPRWVRPVVGAAVATAVLATSVAGVLAWQSFGDDDDGGTGNRGNLSADRGTSSSGPGSPTSPDAGEAGGTQQAPEDQEPAVDDLLTPEGIRSAIAELKPVMGGSVVTDLAVFPDTVHAEALVKGSKTRYDRFVYNRGADVAARDGTGGTVMSGTVPVDLAIFNWDAVPDLLRRAERELNVDAPTSRYLIIDPPSTTFDTEATIDIHFTNDYGGGYLEANADGKVIDVYPMEE